MQKLKLTPDVSFPLDAVTQKFAFLGKSGSGKTYGAGKLAELLIQAGIQTIIIDVIGNWWGLRLAADGKKEGLSIPVIGGTYGDIPVETTGGTIIADYIVQSGSSMVVDISDFTAGETSRFIKDFATHFLQLKKKFKSPVMIIWEECQDYVPQNPMGQEKFALGAMNRLIKQGRNHGVGTTLISQRPQAVNKEVLNQTECMIVFQMTAPHERTAIEGWMKDKAMDKNPLTELPKLKVGECFIWSPGWLNIYVRTSILPKITYDASATPVFGSKEVARDLAPINLEKMSAEMKQTIERAKENDPKELKRQLAEAKKQLSLKGNSNQDEAIKKYEFALQKLGAENKILIDQQNAILNWRESLTKILHQLPKSDVKIPVHFPTPFKIMKGLTAFNDMTDVPLRKKFISPSSFPKQNKTFQESGIKLQNSNGSLGKCERAILSMLIQQPKPATKKKIGLCSKYSPSSGSFNNAISKLRKLGYVEGQGHLVATPSGINAIDVEPLPTGSELINYWADYLPLAESKIFRVLVNAYPKPLSHDEIARQAEYSETSGSFNNALSSLRTRDLITGYKNDIKASEELF